jgi:hypothetical protein
MTIKYIQRIADGGEIYLLIPGQQNLYILLNLKHLLFTGGDLKFSQGASNGVRGRRDWGYCYHSSKYISLKDQGLWFTAPAGARVKYRGPAMPATTSTAVCQRMAGTRKEDTMIEILVIILLVFLIYKFARGIGSIPSESPDPPPLVDYDDSLFKDREEADPKTGQKGRDIPYNF